MPSKKQTHPKKAPRRLSTKALTLNEASEPDSTYFLKLVLYVLLGTLWLKFANPIVWLDTPVSGIPFGLLLGLLLVRWFENYQTDRKIWYAILVVVTIISYFVPAGIVI